MSPKYIRHILMMILVFTAPLCLYAQPANLMVGPTPLTFLTIEAGDSTSETVYVSLLDPLDPTPTGINEITIIGDEFSYNFSYPLPLWISSGMTVEINVNFAPLAPGVFVGMLLVHDVHGHSYSVELNGQTPADVIGPLFDIFPASVNLPVLETSTEIVEFTIYNRGGELLEVLLNYDTVPYWIYITESLAAGIPFTTAEISPGDSLQLVALVDASDQMPHTEYVILNFETNSLGGGSENWDFTVEIGYLPVRALFDASATSIFVGDEVQFFDQSRTNPAYPSITVNSWEWDLNGDGFVDSEQQNPTFTYTAPGLYNVSLFVDTIAGDSNFLLKEEYIQVQAYPDLYAVPDSLNFGNVSLGVTRVELVTIDVPIDALYGQNGIDMISTSNPVFAIDTTGYIFPIELGEGTNVEFEVQFSPDVAGEHSGYIFVTDLHGRTLEIPLYGTASQDLDIVFNPPSHVTAMQELYSGNVNLSLRNLTENSISYNVDNSSLPDWLSFGSGSLRLAGTLNPGDSTSVLVQYSSWDLDPGEVYSHSIDFLISDGTTSVHKFWDIELTVQYLHVRAIFDAMSYEAGIGQDINFVDQSRIDPDDVSGDSIVAWEWDFNFDGTIDSYAQHPVHSFDSLGVYTVGLKVRTLLGNWHQSVREDFITITNYPPVVFAPIDTLTIEEDSQYIINLHDVFSDPQDEQLFFTAYRSTHIDLFDNGDGVYFVIPQEDWWGVETISFTATDPWGLSATHDIVVTVTSVNDAPILSVPDSFYMIRNSQLMIDFAQYVQDPDNPIGDISIVITQLFPVHGNVLLSYNANTPGDLVTRWNTVPDWWGFARYRITFNDNESRAISMAEFSLYVLENFDVQFSTVGGPYTLAGQTIPFVDETLGNPDWWEWDFEDNGTIDSFEQNPSHVYPYGGSYSVRLTLGNTMAGIQATTVYLDYLELFGTAITPDNPAPPEMDIDGSPYNVSDNFIFPVGGEVWVDPEVVINFLSPNPVLLDGSFNASGATFQGEGGGAWGGLQIDENSQLFLNNCTFNNATNPLRVQNSSPSLHNLQIYFDPQAGTPQGSGIQLSNSSANISGLMVYNYYPGILIQGGLPGTRTTPTLTNIRVRNSSETQRREGEDTGIKIEGESSPILSDVIVEDMEVGISITNETFGAATPTLTNIRVRNSSETQRNLDYGILIDGNVLADLDDVEIVGAAVGIFYTGSESLLRDTPTLTNIRVRNSSETQRPFSKGIHLYDLSSVILDDIEIENRSTGIFIDTSEDRTLSTPTLTNIRVRNSSETQRSFGTGIEIAGNTLATIDEAIIENCETAINYNKSGDSSRNLTTPTLTNIRVRNSSETQRGERFGFLLHNLERVIVSDDSLGGCTTAIRITADNRTLSTPTLTNIRVRNSSETQRFPNSGIVLGAGVRGTLSDCSIESAQVGLLIENGNSTRLGANFFKNNGTAIRATGLQDGYEIAHQTITLDQDVLYGNLGWTFRGMEIFNSPDLLLKQNTIFNYPSGVRAIDSNIVFSSNIIWGMENVNTPLSGIGSQIISNYNDIRWTGGIFPGEGNVNTPPFFISPIDDDFSLSSQSPCIDSGAPWLPPDPDGTRADMGSNIYLHRAAFMGDMRFVQTGTTVSFSNLSLGHNEPQLTQVMWDLGNNGTIDSMDRDWVHTFTQSGLYDIKLTMQTGVLVDEIVILRAIVVQDNLLQAPVMESVSAQGSDISINWAPVTDTVAGDPIGVNYYLVFTNTKPEGYFNYLGYTEAPITSYLHAGGADAHSRFYFVIGFAGTRAQLDDYIRQYRALDPTQELPQTIQRSRD